MQIILAPNAFKNSLSAETVCAAIRQGLTKSGFPCTIRDFPIGDGGDGTASLIVKIFQGRLEEVSASDPLGRQIKTFIGFIEAGKTAVIEMAAVSGLKVLLSEERDPLRASSAGTGELIRMAMDRGYRKIILCIGGSATVDGGCGILQALGIRFLDSSGRELRSLPENGMQLESIDVSGLDKRIFETELTVLCDVDNFLTGEKGAATVFGPQKGASAKDILLLENALCRLRDVWLLQSGRDMNLIRHGGAAGGAAAGLHSFLDAVLVQGIEYFLDRTQFDSALEKADLLITGEGSIDLQTLDGKGPFGVARRAKKKNIPVMALAGKIPLVPDPRLLEYFDALLAIGHQPEDLRKSMELVFENLERSAFQLGKIMSIAQVLRDDPI